MARYPLGDMEEVEIAGRKRLVCPECRSHVQEDPERAYDCKNLYRTATGWGQCACYAMEHGVRNRRADAP